MFTFMVNILLVEDELSIAESLVYAMETEHFSVKHVVTGGEALTYLEQVNKGVDLAILDLGLPDMSGFDLCQKIQAKYAMPVMFLTARDNEIDRVLGLELGGDDYVVKPFSPREVTARVRAILRRCGKERLSNEQTVVGTDRDQDLEHDLDRKVFILKGEVHGMTLEQ